MHEGAIAQSILDILKQVAEDNGMARITRVRLKIGKLSGVMIDALMFALDALRHEEGLISGALFEVTETQIRARCALCNTEYTFDDATDMVLLCRQCHMPLEVTAGREMEIIGVEGE